jgi:hypothetical protein
LPFENRQEKLRAQGSDGAMTGLHQLYQRLQVRATEFFEERVSRDRVHTVRTEVTVEQEERLWLMRDIANRREDTCPVCGQHLLADQNQAPACVHTVEPDSKRNSIGEVK